MSTSQQRAVMRVLDYLRAGGLLMKMHNSTYGRRWYTLPTSKGRQQPAREVEDHIAELVLRDVNVFPRRDGIWSGCDQTYGWGDKE